MTPPALAARDVVVRFVGLTAVDGVDLEIRAGERYDPAV